MYLASKNQVTSLRYKVLQALLLQRGSPLPQYSIYRSFFEPQNRVIFLFTAVFLWWK